MALIGGYVEPFSKNAADPSIRNRSFVFEAISLDENPNNTCYGDHASVSPDHEFSKNLQHLRFDQ
jgi:hypothetical protein